MTHPERVTELVLRGIFLLRDKEIAWFYQGPGAGFVFPAEWAAYENAIPTNERHNYLEAYGKRLRGELGEEGMVCCLPLDIILLLYLSAACVMMLIFAYYKYSELRSAACHNIAFTVLQCFVALPSH
jgi:hypothetical protein